ncbi:hypothetical protein VP01_456g7 [Puccinia sorghi]|uniref:Uncharacterized protein n=1 Tax=Puccinia sorghi TaxID=27349 RepID=A0A0L6UNQ7_9BASI|nr:hypothetical protein VP01_456g7 [Puccinia sorghi]
MTRDCETQNHFCIWAHAQVPLGIVPRELGLVPRGLNQAACLGHGSWHTAKFCLAQPKL